MYLSNLIVNRPKGTKIIHNKTTSYVYHILKKEYIKSKRSYNEVKVCIGKMVFGSDTKMIPNDKFEKYYSDYEIEYVELPDIPKFSRTLACGSFILIRKIANDTCITKILNSIFGKDDSINILNIISFFLTSESSTFQYYKEFMRKHLQLGHKILTDVEICSRILFKVITDVKIQNTLREWNSLFKDNIKVYIHCDSTNFNTESENISIANYGHAKDDSNIPQFNMALCLKSDDHIPLYYDLFEGSIIDLVQCEDFISKISDFGYKNIGLVFDRGYYFEANIRQLDSMEFDFIMMMREDHNIVKEIIKENRNLIKHKYDSYIGEFRLFGITTKKELYGKIRFLHIYYDNIVASQKEEAFLHLVYSLERDLKKLQNKRLKANTNLQKYKRFFDIKINPQSNILESFVKKIDFIEEYISYLGFFVLVSSEEMTAEDAIITYRSRDNIEKFFCSIKSGLDFHRARVHNDIRLQSKVFLIFLTGIIRQKILNVSRVLKSNTKNKKFYTVPSIIHTLDYIECSKDSNNIYKREYSLSNAQKMILNEFNIDEKYIDECIDLFNNSDKLNNNIK